MTFRALMTNTCALAIAMAGCDVDPPLAGSATGEQDAAPLLDGGGDDSGDNCPDDARLIYVIDQNNKLSRFDPSTNAFADLGTLACQTEAGATPFSMGIDRTATAWVLFSSGELFRVDTTTLACTTTAWAPNTQGHAVFSMGFTSDTVGGTTDRLFIAGGADPTFPPSTLARLDTGSFVPSTVGTIQGWPELSGTSTAELWGFFPAPTGSRIAQLDKTNGSTLRMFSLTTLTGMPTAWAFAAHGGSFWVFLMKDLETDTTVYQLNSMTGSLVGMTRANGRTIVGAGVSTCAPTGVRAARYRVVSTSQ